jgi:hypothetical protein
MFSTDLMFDPRSASFVEDPYKTYAALREQAPVHKSSLGFRVITRYVDVQ